MPDFAEWATIANHLMEHGGRLVVVFHLEQDAPPSRGASVGYEFGREAPDSDMAAGAAYGTGATVDEAMIKMTSQLGWS